MFFCAHLYNSKHDSSTGAKDIRACQKMGLHREYIYGAKEGAGSTI